MRIAAVDDDPAQLDLVRHCVEAIGHVAHAYPAAEPLLHALRRESFDLLIVDWELPDLSGLDLVRRVREQQGSALPILFLTNRGDERDVVAALGAGADDYMVKPTRVQELMARVRALLRRSYPQAQVTALQLGGFRLDLVARSASWQGERVELRPKEFELAQLLFAHCGRLLSRAHLVEQVWGHAADLPSRSLDTHMHALRAKLGLRPERGYRLAAVYGQGYRLEEVAPVAQDVEAGR